MNFLNMGPGEMILILIIALVVFGPGKLPEIGRAVGRGMREFRQATSSITSELTREIEDVKTTVNEVKTTVDDVKTTATSAANDIRNEVQLKEVHRQPEAVDEVKPATTTTIREADLAPAEEPAPAEDAAPAPNEEVAPAEEPVQIEAPVAESVPTEAEESDAKQEANA